MKYPICEGMLCSVSYGYNVSRKTVKRDVDGLYIAFSGAVWGKMGGGRELVKIKYSKLVLHPDYKNIGKLRLTKANTFHYNTQSEYKGNPFFNMRKDYDEAVKNGILEKRAMQE